MNRKLLISITKKDFEIQTFRCGGKGGQKVNKTSSGVRIIHRESGAVGESTTERSQHQNKKLALQRLTKTSKFRIWLNRKAFELMQGKTIEQRLDDEMNETNLKFEIKDENGKWKKTEKI